MRCRDVPSAGARALRRQVYGEAGGRVVGTRRASRVRGARAKKSRILRSVVVVAVKRPLPHSRVQVLFGRTLRKNAVAVVVVVVSGGGGGGGGVFAVACRHARANAGFRCECVAPASAFVRRLAAVFSRFYLDLLLQCVCRSVSRGVSVSKCVCVCGCVLAAATTTTQRDGGGDAQTIPRANARVSRR